MREKMYKKESGFTLIEIVMTVMVLGLVFIGVFSFLNNSGKMSKMQDEEFYFQSDMRDSMLKIENTVKKSKAVFAVQAKDFLNSSGVPFDKDWTYIGVATHGKNKGQVCMFQHDGSNWNETPLTAGKGGVAYDLVFDKKVEEGSGQRKLSYTVTGTPNEDKKLSRSMTSTTEVLSAFTVVDRSKEDPGAGPAVALAFRTGDIGVSKGGFGSITFVIDISGSMGYAMENEGAGFVNNKSTQDIPRMKAVERSLKEMLAYLEENDIDADISFVDYTQWAKNIKINKQKYAKLKSNYSSIVGLVKTISKLHADTYPYAYFDDGDNEVPLVKYDAKMERYHGETNVGDALRIAYANLLNKNKSTTLNSSANKPNDYIILLSDGLPSARTVYCHKEKNKLITDYGKVYLGPDELKDKKDQQTEITTTEYYLTTGDVYTNNIETKNTDPYPETPTRTYFINKNGEKRDFWEYFGYGNVFTPFSTAKNYFYHDTSKYYIRSDLYSELKKSGDPKILQGLNGACIIRGTMYNFQYYLDGVRSQFYDLYALPNLTDQNYREYFRNYDDIGYVELVAEKYLPQLPRLKSFLITVGKIGESGEARKNSFERINKAMGNQKSNYYPADNIEELKKAISNIAQIILMDSWTYNGPVKN